MRPQKAGSLELETLFRYKYSPLCESRVDHMVGKFTTFDCPRFPFFQLPSLSLSFLSFLSLIGVCMFLFLYKKISRRVCQKEAGLLMLIAGYYHEWVHSARTSIRSAICA